jgi:4'-phosphopantetheinyl transferase
MSLIQPQGVWLEPPERLSLERDDVHVWRISLDQGRIVSRTLWPLLMPDERQRAGRYHFEKDRRRFIIARGALRRILGRYLNLPPERIEFSYSRYGKPALGHAAQAGDIRFNVSHSHDLALCAVAYGREVGLDVEFIREELAELSIAESYFSPAEVATLRALSPELHKIAFFNCWTRKEAYVKACGEGLSYPLQRFSVSLIPGERARLLSVDEPHEADRWSLVELFQQNNYVAALVVEGGAPRLRCWQYPDGLQ